MAALPRGTSVEEKATEERSYGGPSFGAKADEQAKRREAELALVKEASTNGISNAKRDEVRRAALAEIPWWYSPYAHLAATTGVGIATLAVSIWQLHARHATMKVTDFLVIPLVCLLANFFEWRVHKHVLHRRFWPFEIIYDKHTPMHHMVYVEDDMALRSVKEFRLVLIPAMGVLGIVLGTAPVAIAVGQLWSTTAGWLFLVTASLFMVSYEILHLCYHAPKDTIIGRNPIIAKLRAHHAKHHDPRYMQRWNFNVTVPLFDWIMGTMAPAGELPPRAKKSPHSKKK